MKSFFLSLAFLLAFVSAPVVHAEGYGSEAIRTFTSDVTVRTDGNVEVIETITYDFGTAERHGVYRDIPLTRVAGRVRALGIRALSVTDEAGTPYTTDLSASSGEVQVRIGDADRLVTGVHTYRIAYLVTYGIGHFDDRDEIYWNATGHDWQVPILAATTTVRIPGKLESGFPVASYCGPYGGTASCGAPEVHYDPASDQTLVTFARTGLAPGEGMTVAVGIPRGIVPVPSRWEVWTSLLHDNWQLILTVAFFAIVFLAFFILPLLILLFRAGSIFAHSLAAKIREQRFFSTHPVIAEYDPGEFTPLEAGILLTKGIKDRYLSAEIIWLAERGYLTIDYNKGDYAFRRTEKPVDALSNYDRELLDGVAGKTKADLVYEFYTTARKATDAVAKGLRTDGYIVGKPSAGLPLPAQLMLVFVMALFAGIFFLSFIASVVVVALYALIRLTGYGTMWLTAKGLEARLLLKGLELYISVAETARITFHNAPEKTPTVFERFLPYAIAFGLEKQWAAQFEGIYLTQPTWYTGDPSFNSFNAGVFAASMHDFSSRTAYALTSVPSSGSSGSFSGSGGGGFSGGGGGGGGGGSW